MTICQNSRMADLTAVGLGLGYHEIRLEKTTGAWLAVGAELRDQVAQTLDGAVADVEVVGSSSVLDLLAKPIIDLAVALKTDQPLFVVTEKLESAGWIYRGDAGKNGGQVFVLEVRPWYRVAHLHVVEHDGAQWRNYICLRDLLRRSPVAREKYQAVKLRLAGQDHADREAYASGKVGVVSSLLDGDV
jgi:GrpB-like predicted nucleotidyltransferase (UPF0157 family)